MICNQTKLYILLYVITTTGCMGQTLAPSNFKTIGEYMKSSFYKRVKSEFDYMMGPKFKAGIAPSNKTFEFNNVPELKLKEMFKNFKNEFSLTFTNNEDEFRYQLFKKNYMRIQNHNMKNDTFKMSMNQFMIKLPEEFESEFLEKPKIIKMEDAAISRRLLEDDSAVLSRLDKYPSVLDWTIKGKVTPVKSQEKCSGCYVFSAIAALESAIMIKYDRTLVLSEQEMLDCTKSFRNNGCSGGQPTFVYDYIKTNGINLADNYTYTGTEERCKAPTRMGVFKRLASYVQPEPNVISLIEFLQYGPIVVNHYIPDDFKYYAAGVFYTPDCYHQTTINHSSLLVGYDFTVDPPYFKLKNSWGVKWGEKGYYKVMIGQLNLKNPGFCYLANNGYNVFPIVQ